MYSCLNYQDNKVNPLFLFAIEDNAKSYQTTLIIPKL